MKSAIKFNKIIVIESSGGNDLHTGRRLFYDVIRWKRGVHSEFLTVSRSSELLRILQDLADQMESQTIHPIIHMDFHGDEIGILLSSGEQMTWDDLQPVLQTINLRCRNSLLITLAACKGVYLTKIVNPTDHTPFWGLIAPSDDISQGRIDSDYKSFYETLLFSLRGDKALAQIADPTAANRAYSFIHCINLYKRAYTSYYQQFCSRKNRQSQTERLITRIRTTPWGNQFPPKELRKRIKNERGDPKTNFEKFRKIFFMIYLYPENESRFPIRFEDLDL